MKGKQPKFRWIDWRDWCNGEEGKSCLSNSIIRRPEDMQYLENRLWRAFSAGREQAAREIGPRPARRKGKR